MNINFSIHSFLKQQFSASTFPFLRQAIGAQTDNGSELWHFRALLGVQGKQINILDGLSEAKAVLV